jgi:hypothetical protein
MSMAKEPASNSAKLHPITIAIDDGGLYEEEVSGAEGTCYTR